MKPTKTLPGDMNAAGCRVHKAGKHPPLEAGKHPPTGVHACVSALMLGGLLLLATAASAGSSPEFTQLLNDVRKELDLLPASAAGGHVSDICPVLALMHGTDALKDRLIRDTINVVVVEPLNDGIKFTASALGVGTIAIAAYDVARCAYDSDQAKDMGNCLVKAAWGAFDNALGGVAGGDNNLKGALVSLGSEKSRKLADELGDAYFESAKDSVNGYQAAVERFDENIGDGRCESMIKATWDRHRRTRSRGGSIKLLVHTQCHCDAEGGYRPTTLGGAHRLRTGFFRIEIPVRMTRASADRNAPGWRLGPLGNTQVWGGCCGLETYFHRTLDSQGNVVRDAGQPGAGTPPSTGTSNPTGGSTRPTGQPSTPMPTPKPEPDSASTPAPAEPAWSLENPCPTCRSLAHALATARATLQAARAALSAGEQSLTAATARIAALNAEIVTLENRIRAQQGIGGTSFDPSTGITVQSYDQGNGQVKITTTYPDGRTEVRYRSRESTAAIRSQLEAARAERDAVSEEQSRLEQSVRTAGQFVNVSADRVRVLEAQLVDCLNTQCRLNLSSARSEPLGSEDATALIVELDGDGENDVVVANSMSGEVLVYFGDGVTFTVGTVIHRLDGPGTLAAADLNFDGFSEIVVADQYSAEVAVILNRGQRSFQVGATEIVDRVPRSLSVGDLTDDRVPDVQIVDQSAADGRVLEGLGDGGLGIGIGLLETPLDSGSRIDPMMNRIVPLSR